MHQSRRLLRTRPVLDLLPPLVESLERLSPEDLALREVAEGKISYELGPDEIRVNAGSLTRPRLLDSKPFVRPDSGLRSSSKDSFL